MIFPPSIVIAAHELETLWNELQHYDAEFAFVAPTERPITPEDVEHYTKHCLAFALKLLAHRSMVRCVEALDQVGGEIAHAGDAS